MRTIMKTKQKLENLAKKRLARSNVSIISGYRRFVILLTNEARRQSQEEKKVR